MDLPSCWIGKRAQCQVCAAGHMAPCPTVREWCHQSTGTGGLRIAQSAVRSLGSLLGQYRAALCTLQYALPKMGKRGGQEGERCVPIHVSPSFSPSQAQ